MTAMGLVLMPVQAAFSRAMERRADRFAVDLTRNSDAYARAMEGLAARVGRPGSAAPGRRDALFASADRRTHSRRPRRRRQFRMNLE